MNNTENKSKEVIDSNFAVDLILNDKLDSTGVKLLSDSQDKLIKNLKDKDEK